VGEIVPEINNCWRRTNLCCLETAW